MRTDDEIREEVEEALKLEPLLHNTEVKVTVKNGSVTLSGKICGYLGKLAASQAAARIKGVKNVNDKIEVRLAVYDCLDDRIINIEIHNALYWHRTVPPDKITATVKNGIVTLTGQADEPYQQEIVINAIGRLRGIKNIINHIKIQQQPDKPHGQFPGGYRN